jgi:hypothetical protein
MEAVLADPDGGQRWVIYDEPWRLVRQAALLARMQTHWKLSRAWGIANLMIIHRLSDLDAVGEANSEARNLALGLLADCSTKVIYAQAFGCMALDLWRTHDHTTRKSCDARTAIPLDDGNHRCVRPDLIAVVANQVPHAPAAVGLSAGEEYRASDLV